MRILTDLHHFDLFHSFQRLFEDRLGHTLYRPIGIDWLSKDFWALSEDPELAECILSVESGRCAEILNQYDSLKDKDWAVMALHLPRVGKISEEAEGVYLINDLSKDDVQQRGITLETFKNTRFDIIISSVPQHFDRYERLRKLYQPHAKHIFHMGPGDKNWPIPDGARNLLLHSPPLGSLDGINHVYYHQEFDLKNFTYSPPSTTSIINSYVYFPATEKLWNSLDLANTHTHQFIGRILGPLDNIILKTEDLGRRISESAFTLHIKPGGESYGYILHNSMSSGRPVIINGADFKDKMGGKLLEHGVTCIDVSKYTNPKDLTSAIQIFSQHETHLKMCEQARTRFEEVVNFDQEEVQLKSFLERAQ